jgi:hypothetical protein
VRRLAAWALVLALASAACSRAPRARDPWAASAATAHHQADRLLDAGDAAGARAALRSFVVAGAGAGATSERHRRALQDTYFRLSRLALAAHDAQQALADADAGLAYGEAPHLFVANLLVARGAAREAEGDGRGAAEDYHRALLMNEALLEKELPQ